MKKFTSLEENWPITVLLEVLLMLSTEQNVGFPIFSENVLEIY